MSEQVVERPRRGRASSSEASDERVSQSQIIRRNISAISAVQDKDDAARTFSERVSDLVTRFSGSMLFVWLHALWFGLWILLNVGLLHIPHVSEFDPFPFGLLTMIVSLEAIFLSTFVLISQNRMARLSERRSELDLHVNLLAEQKATKTLEMLDIIAKQLSQLNRFDIPHDPEIEALKVSPEPQDVLHVLKDAVQNKAEEVKQAVDEVVDEITGEMEAVRDEVKEAKEDVSQEMKEVRKKVEVVAQEVDEIKERTGDHSPVSLK
ncbi:MAG TPA: DUF1003 domain-containing protein [Pyrinomonadaceae bacterium]